MHVRSTEQQLVDICFQLVAATEHEWFKTATLEQKMEWVAQQLAANGFPTTPMGASWGVLTNGS